MSADMGASVRDLARNVAAAVMHEPTALSIKNLSSLSTADTAEIRRTLREAGFDQVREWDATPFFTNDPVVRSGCRTLYLARKAQN